MKILILIKNLAMLIAMEIVIIVGLMLYLLLLPVELLCDKLVTLLNLCIQKREQLQEQIVK